VRRRCGPGPNTIDELGEDLVELIDSLGVQRFSLGGLSLGGMVAMRLALFCTSAYLPPAQGWLDRAEAVLSGGTASIADAVVGRWFSAAFATAQPAVVAAQREQLIATPAEGYARGDPDRADPLLQPCGLSGDLIGGCPADVLQQAQHHVAVVALGPAADDVTAPPDSRPGVTVASKSAFAWSPRNQSRDSQPITVESRPGRSTACGVGVAVGCTSSASCSTSASQPGASSVSCASARRRSVLRRSRAAMACVHAACTLGTSSTETTNIVRRIPSMRTSDRSSYRAPWTASMGGCRSRAQAPR